jgi:hypothetical protein
MLCEPGVSRCFGCTFLLLDALSLPLLELSFRPYVSAISVRTSVFMDHGCAVNNMSLANMQTCFHTCHMSWTSQRPSEHHFRRRYLPGDSIIFNTTLIVLQMSYLTLNLKYRNRRGSNTMNSNTQPPPTSSYGMMLYV